MVLWCCGAVLASLGLLSRAPAGGGNLQGFFARPAKNEDGSTNMMKWECGIPGKEGTNWEGAVWRAWRWSGGVARPFAHPACRCRRRRVSSEHGVSRRVPVQAAQVQVRAAALPPECVPLWCACELAEPAMLFGVAFRLSSCTHGRSGAVAAGTVCLSILNEEEDWRPAITVKQVLMGIQDLLDNPNPNSPAQREAFELYVYVPLPTF